MSGETPPRTSLWGGLGSLWNSVVKTTLDTIDGFQDRITEIDSQITSQLRGTPVRQFDESLLPILENSSTYLDQPTSPTYSSYLNSFDVDSHVDEITLFCDHSPTLRRIHSRLVPSAFSNRVFWSRLFFKLEQRENAKKKSQELLELVAEAGKPPKMDALTDAPIELTEEELAELEQLAEEGAADWE
jgi:hypothetical protein